MVANTTGTPPGPEQSIPRELLELAQWVCWKLEPGPDGRPTKVPYNARTGNKASTTNPQTWSTYAVACKRARQPGYSGIGFVVTANDPVSGVDLDKCRDAETGEIAAWAREWVEVLDSYTEVSPSGTGLRVFVRAVLPDGRRRQGGIEVYDSGRFFTVTGNHVDGTPLCVEDRQSELLELYHRYVAAPTEPVRKPTPSQPTRLDDAAIVKKAMAAENGAKFSALWNGDTSDYGGDESRADGGLLGILAFYTRDEAQLDRLFRQSGLMREKWERADYRERTIRGVLAKVGETYKPARGASPVQQPVTPHRTEGANALKGAPEVAAYDPDDLTQFGLARRLLAQHRPNIRYNKAFGFVIWTGQRWQIADGDMRVQAWAMEIVEQAYQEAERAGGDAKTAMRRKTAATVEAMMRLIRPDCLMPPEAFDADPWLFNCANGTLDLRTGELREHRREDYLTQCSFIAYRPNAKCPTFLAFVRQIMCERDELTAYLQRIFGYCLTGDVSEQIWHLMVGAGANGKSTLMETLAYVLGDYAGVLEPEAICTSGRPTDAGAATPHLAALKGKRFVRVTETEQGARLAVARIKRMTGGDAQSARFLHKDIFTYTANYKLFIYTNHKPQARETGHAFWRRVRYIPFDWSARQHPKAKDKHLPEKLQREAEGILAWLVQGCLEWQRVGLMPPQVVLDATSEYERESDVLGLFLAERCATNESYSVRSRALYVAYKDWCDEAGEKPLAERNFSMALGDRGFKKAVMRDGNWWLALGLKIRED